jgi:hypothetical protein
MFDVSQSLGNAPDEFLEEESFELRVIVYCFKGTFRDYIVNVVSEFVEQLLRKEVGVKGFPGSLELDFEVAERNWLIL